MHDMSSESVTFLTCLPPFNCFTSRLILPLPAIEYRQCVCSFVKTKKRSKCIQDHALLPDSFRLQFISLISFFNVYLYEYESYLSMKLSMKSDYLHTACTTTTATPTITTLPHHNVVINLILFFHFQQHQMFRFNNRRNTTISIMMQILGYRFAINPL